MPLTRGDVEVPSRAILILSANHQGTNFPRRRCRSIWPPAASLGGGCCWLADAAMRDYRAAGERVRGTFSRNGKAFQSCLCEINPG